MKRILGAALVALTAIVAAGTATSSHAGDSLTVERFTEAFRDNYTGYYYKNLTNMEKFVAALEDPYTPDQYDALTDRSRFSALDREKNEAVYGLAYGDIDYLTTAATLPVSKKIQRTAAVKETSCTN